jgi:protein TonB
MTQSRDEFDVLLDEVLWEHANPAAPAGMEERLMMRLWAEGMERQMAAMPAALASFDGAGRAESMWASLWSGVRELVAPRRQPELVLKSRPVEVLTPMDRIAERGGFGAKVWAVALHGVALLLVALLMRSGVKMMAPVQMAKVIELPEAAPRLVPRAQMAGGGGGQRGPTPVTRGTPPKLAAQQMVPPKAPPMQEPKIKIEPTVEGQTEVKMASSLPQMGIARSPLVGMSMGNGRGNGLGSGDGAGIGAGSGGNTGGGPRRIGGGVSAPVLVYQVEPESSEEARKAKVSGNVLVNLWVDTRGNPTHVHVLRGIGLGLDEKAVAAVKLYKFRPAMENGKPVLVEMNVEVIFQIF